MQKFIFLAASLLGALSVIIGAFGEHAFRNFLEASNRAGTFETAVKYQFYHTLALLAVGLLMFKLDSKLLDFAAISFLSGIIIFSGSLYVLCFTGVAKWGAVTPIGGLFLIIGWSLLFVSVFKSFQA